MNDSESPAAVAAEGKVVVYIADNGRTIELDCEGTTLVEAVNRYIESAVGIPSSDQLLLCRDAKLESNRPLSDYNLGRGVAGQGGGGGEVFVYNRTRLHHDAPPPRPERIEALPEPAEPPAPLPSHDPHPLDDAPDPAVKALPSYERQFRHHYQRGLAVYDATDARFTACERLLMEQVVQERAVEAAKGTMEHYYRRITQNYADFERDYSHQRRVHSDILAGFERDLERLTVCKLHPLLQTESRKCLLDLLKVEELKTWAESCGTSHRLFETKVSQLKAMFADLRRKVEELYSNRALAGIRELDMTIREHQKYMDEQKSIMQSLSKDVTTVKKLVDDCLNSQLSLSLRPHDAVSALGPMYDVHDKDQLPKMQACYRAITKLLNFCQARKNQMNLFVYNSMQKVAYVQLVVKDLRHQFPAFREAMSCQDKNFEHLKLVRAVGPAYRACLAEVVRRKASMKLYMGMAGQYAERLAMKRETEARRREDFNKTQGASIPRDILSAMGLYDSPSHCDVNVAPFDLNLLNIDIADVDRYAPENLFGLSSKTEKRDSQAGSSTMSNSSHLTDAGENSFGTFDNCDDGEFLEGCASEIAGTSKMEVENARLKAELASALARLCISNPETAYACLDDSRMENILKVTAQKTQEALKLKDEHREQLESLLRSKQMQCVSYEKRIQELELKLQNQYMQQQKTLGSQETSDVIFSASKTDDCKSEIDEDSGVPVAISVTEPMDEVFCTSPPLLPAFSMPKTHDGIDENMTDSSAVSCNPIVDSARSIMDASMQDPHRDETHLGDEIGEVKSKDSLNLKSHETVVDPSLVSKAHEDAVLELKKAVQEKSLECAKAETKLEAAMEEVASLRRELDESQMNCAHLENCLHEAREEAHINLCAADRRASDYNKFRASVIKMRGLLERLRSCVSATCGFTTFVESFCALANSLPSSVNENEDDGCIEFSTCMKILAERVNWLYGQRVEQMDRCSKLEVSLGTLTRELEEKKELVKGLYAKHQLEKQANKERISFRRFDVHELAAFVLNSSGHYEALNRNCKNYYLSSESIALFADHLPVRPAYIIGQIVHIERKIVRSHMLSLDQTDDRKSDHGEIQMSTPYNLPVGCEYFVVTVAMLPDPIHSSPS